MTFFRCANASKKRQNNISIFHDQKMTCWFFPKTDVFFQKFYEKLMTNAWKTSKNTQTATGTCNAGGMLRSRIWFHESGICVYFADPDGCEGGCCVTFTKMEIWKIEILKNRNSEKWSLQRRPPRGPALTLCGRHASTGLCRGVPPGTFFFKIPSFFGPDINLCLTPRDLPLCKE